MNILIDYDFMHLGDDPKDLFFPLLNGPLRLPQTLEILEYQDKVAPGHANDPPPPGFRLATNDEAARASLFTVPRAPFDSLPERKQPARDPNTAGLEARYIKAHPDRVVVFPNNRISQCRQLMLYTPGPTIDGVSTWRIICTNLYSSSNPGNYRGRIFIGVRALLLAGLLGTASPSSPTESVTTPESTCDCWTVSDTPYGKNIEHDSGCECA